MRIGIDFRLAGTGHGGIGRYVFELLKHLLILNHEDEFVIFYNHQSKDLIAELTHHPKFNSKIKWVLVNIRHYSVAEQLFLPFILNRYKLDLMHFPNFNVPVLYKYPFMVTIHDLIHHKLGGVKKSNFLHFLAYKYIIKSAVQSAKKIITVSEASKSDLIKEFGIPPSKIQVIYEAPFAPVPFSSQMAQDFKAHYLIDKPYFLFVGVKQRNKNLPKLCEAFALFLNQINKDYYLVIAGKKDPHYPNISEECLNICRNNLIFVEHFSDSDLEILYRNAFGFVSASTFEGFGLPGLEAMSRGLPLAVSNLKVFNEIYENGAIYFNPKDVLEMAECFKILANDLPYYNQIREAGLKRAQNFSWQTCAQATLNLYYQTK